MTNYFNSAEEISLFGRKQASVKGQDWLSNMQKKRPLMEMK